MDGLVKGGIELDQAYAYQYCSPTRSSLQSGRLPTHARLFCVSLSFPARHSFFALSSARAPALSLFSSPRALCCIKTRTAVQYTANNGVHDGAAGALVETPYPPLQHAALTCLCIAFARLPPSGSLCLSLSRSVCLSLSLALSLSLSRLALSLSMSLSLLSRSATAG